MGDATTFNSSSKNLGLSPIKKLGSSSFPSTNEGQNFKNVPIGDFSSVFHDNDVTICSDFDELYDCMEIESSSNTSLSVNGSMDLTDVDTPSRPYVPFSTEEVSLVKTIDCWSNCNVRVMGTMSPTRENCDHFLLESVGEEGGPFSILVDVKLLMAVPPTGTAVQVFGEIQMMPNSMQPKPFILAKFFRDISSVDLSYYHKALEEVKKYVPHFMKKRKTCVQQVLGEDSQSDHQ